MYRCLFFFVSGSKGDIPVSKYRLHTLGCSSSTSTVRCPECDDVVLKADLEDHKRDCHTFRLCNMCDTSVEAFKLAEHQV